MKNKKGFTLIELLAVIVILGIIMTIAGTAVRGVRKNANIESAKKLEKTLKDLGPEIFSYEMSLSASSNNFHYNYNELESTSVDLGSITNIAERKNYQGYSLLNTTEELKVKGYLKSDKLKIGNDECKGFIRIYKTDNGPFFEGNLCCEGIYSTNKGDGVSGDNCNWYTKSNSVDSIGEYTPTSSQGFVTELSD